MRQVPEALSLVLSSFPDRSELIERAFRDHVPFRTLCQDYRVCVKALFRWKELEPNERAPRWYEYAELKVELGREIQACLDAIEAGGSHSEGE